VAIYRAEVVGSLLRPACLKQARLDLAADGPCGGTATYDATMGKSCKYRRAAGALAARRPGSIGLKVVRTG